MSSVVKIPTDLMRASQDLAEADFDPNAGGIEIAQVSQKKRAQAHARSRAVQVVERARNDQGYPSISAAVDGVLELARSAPKAYQELYAVGRGGNLVSRATLISWCTAFNEGGVTALIPGHKGSKRTDYEWGPLALKLYRSPSRPYISTVAFWLRTNHGYDVEDHQVRSVINRLPITETRFSRDRVGSHYYEQNHECYVTRDYSSLPVGHTWTSDGHTCDVYVAHPANGGPWRPELTVWMDLKSNMVVGWHVTKAESSITSIESFASAIHSNQHVPANIYVDPGPGFKNNVFSEGPQSMCARLNVRVTYAIPGNAKGKGLVEGWFRWFEERCGKQFETHTSKVRTDDSLRMLTAKVKQGKVTLPSLEEYIDAIEHYVRAYNHNPQEALGCTPIELWNTLDRIPPHMDLAELAMVHEERTVMKGGRINYRNRQYENPILIHLQTKRVVIAVNLSDGSSIQVKDADGRLICVAALVAAKAAIGESVKADDEQRRLEGQIKRLEIKRQNVEQQARPILEADDFMHDEVIVATKVKPISQKTDPSNVIDIAVEESDSINLRDLF